MEIEIDSDKKEITFYNSTLEELCLALYEDFPEEDYKDYKILINERT